MEEGMSEHDLDLATLLFWLKEQHPNVYNEWMGIERIGNLDARDMMWTPIKVPTLVGVSAKCPACGKCVVFDIPPQEPHD